MPQGHEQVDSAWGQSLREVMREVVQSLPDRATLGELVAAAEHNRSLAPVLDIFTVRELIDAACERAARPPGNGGGTRGDAPVDDLFDMAASAAVIRRRADVPDGDLLVLRSLATLGPQREVDLSNSTSLTGEQVRLIVRQLRTKGHVHVEGSGLKRRLKITRHGNTFLRKKARAAGP